MIGIFKLGSTLALAYGKDILVLKVKNLGVEIMRYVIAGEL